MKKKKPADSQPASHSKKQRTWLKILLVLLALLLLYVAYFFVSLPRVSGLGDKNPTTWSMLEIRKEEAAEVKRPFHPKFKWVDFKKIPKLFREAVRVSEDASFYEHEGIDYDELEKAFQDFWEKGKKLRGASTITQQLAKNLYLSPDQSIIRKIREYFIAKRLEKTLSKNRIFTIYLNIIELGDGIFGAGAAASHFFHKSIQDLDLVEILRLAAIIPKPLKVSPTGNSRYLRWRVRLLALRLYQYRQISRDTYLEIKAAFHR